MNPFTDSTVARPLDPSDRIWPSSDVPDSTDAVTEPPHQIRRGRASPGRGPLRARSAWSRRGRRQDRTESAQPSVKRVAEHWPGSRRTVRSRLFAEQFREQLMKRCFAVLLLAGIPVWAGALDVNTATAEQLRAVRGIGPKTAQIIIDERHRAGPFASFDDLSERVKGIGPKKAATMKASGLQVGDVNPSGKPAVRK